MDARNRTYMGLKVRPCERCGELFQPRDPRSRFCTIACSRTKVWPPPQKPCEICGAIMVKPTEGIGYKAWTNRRYCSKKCLGQSYRRPEVKCRVCDITFHPIVGQREVYCSTDCYLAFVRDFGRAWPGQRLTPQRKRDALRANFTPAQRKQILLLAGHRCKDCGATENLEVDHIVAVALGGTNDMANGQVLCRPCHQGKSRDDMAAFRRSA